MGNMWGGHADAVAAFRRQRAEGFASFRDLSDPKKVERHRITGARESVEDIISTYNDVLSVDFETLRERLQSGKYNAYTVMCAFVWRAMKIDKELQCITEVIRDAIQKAKDLDDTMKRYEPPPKKPLHGLPFSVKSNFNVAGYANTVGLAHLLDEVKTSTCPFVKFLEDQGAIPFCLTNVPQGLLSYVSSNPLYGTTKNPWDFDRTPGGSSGGEAALLAAGGSAFGIGSDLAGSLRIPAAFCGLVTLKPTQDRFVVTGTHGGLPGRGRLGLSFGFYTRNVTDQEYLLGLIVGNPEYRNLCPQSSPARLAPLQPEYLAKTKPRIGYFVDDGFHPVVPSSKRAVEQTITKLKRQGYECVEFQMSGLEPFEPSKIADMLFRNVMPDNGAYMANDIYKGEPYDKHMALFIRLINYKQYTLVRWLTKYIAMPLADSFVSSRLAVLGRAHNAGLPEMRKNQEDTDAFREIWIQYWKHLGIDALICPSFITAAQEFDYPAQLSTGAYLTGLFNMLDVPAGIVPVGHVSEEDIKQLDTREEFPINGDLLMKKQRATSLGTLHLPIAVQVVTLPNEEEMCLRVMKIVEDTVPESDVNRLKWKINDTEALHNFSLETPWSSVTTGKQRSEFFFDRVPLHEPQNV